MGMRVDVGIDPYGGDIIGAWHAGVVVPYGVMKNGAFFVGRGLAPAALSTPPCHLP